MDKITIHCTDTENGKPVSLEHIEATHKARGFSGIGYHFIITIDGQIHSTRKLSETGAHVKGHNVGNVGIALAGKDKFTIEQFRALRKLVTVLFFKFHIGPQDLYVHSEFDTARNQGKSCPNIRSAEIALWCWDEYESAIRRYLL